jgi:8-oxo-dGTP pyrophosphatase MutT (NUDIX family)
MNQPTAVDPADERADRPADERREASMLRDFPLRGPLRTAFAAGPPSAETAAVPVRHAATVMLVRERAGDPGVSLEVFTFRRVPSLAFAAGMLVFPGGAVDPRDADPSVPWAGPAPSSFCTALSADEALARAVVVAAVRETFEECGVLLAGPDGPAGPDGSTGSAGSAGSLAEPLAEPLADDPAWERRRKALIDGDLGLATLLREAGLVLRADLLRAWAHWLTPVGEPRRFDTRFFVATLPAGQQARDLGGEGERASWISPHEALARYRAEDLPMLPPTAVALEELAAAGSLPRLLSAPRSPRPVSPWIAEAGKGPDGEPRHVLRIDLDGVGGGEPRADPVGTV